MKRFENQVAIVTGAGRGIGEAIARRLADEGARVAVVSRTEANSQKTADAINAIAPEAAKPYAVDVADFDAVQKTGRKNPGRFRSLRCSCQQRGHHPRYAGHAHELRRLGCRARHQPEGCVQLFAGRSARDGQATQGTNHQYQLSERADRPRWPGQLFREQGRAGWD